MEARSSRKSKDILRDFSPGIFDLFFRRGQIVHIDDDERSRPRGDRSEGESTRYPAIFEAGVLGTIVLEFPSEDLGIEPLYGGQIVGAKLDVVDGFVAIHRRRIGARCSSCKEGATKSKGTGRVPHISRETSQMWGTRELLPGGLAKTYQRNPNVTGNMLTVPVPTLLFDVAGEFTQT